MLPDSIFVVKHLAAETVVAALRPLATEPDWFLCHYPKLRFQAGCKLISLSAESA
jgi:hypothetical protein